MPTHPITGARYPTTGSSPNGPQQIQDAVTDLSTQVLPRFATTSARDTAFGAWTAAGNTLAEGMFAYTQADDTEWYYNGTAWTWPRVARGYVAPRSSYTSHTTLANTLTGLPAFDTTSTFIPSGRHIRLTFTGHVSFDAASCAYTFTIYKGAFASTLLRKATVHVPLANTAQNFTIVVDTETTTDLSSQLWTIGGQREAGTGTATLVGDGGYGGVQFTVTDIGAV